MNVHRADSRIFGIKGYVGKYPQIHLIGCFLKRGRFQTTAVCSPCRAVSIRTVQSSWYGYEEVYLIVAFPA